MKSTLVCAMPTAALLLIGSFGGARADTSEVKLPAPGDRGKIRQALQRRSALLQSISLLDQARRPCRIPGSFSCSRRAMRSIPT